MKVQDSQIGVQGICLRGIVLDREGVQPLKLEDRITQLFDELREPVYRYLLCLSVDPAEAEEITQETFLRLYRHLHAGRGEENLRGWIFRVAHNISMNSLKGRKYLAPSSTEQWGGLTRSVIGSAPNPEELLLRKEKMIRAHAAISELSGQQRQCLFLRVEGFRYREIADILQVSVSTVAESLRRAIKKLARGSDG